MRKFFADIKKFRGFAFYSARSELKAEVAGSFLSWLWWFLDPLLYMLVYTFVAKFVFGSTVKYFPVFVFIGLNCWTFFSKTVKSSVRLVASNKNIVTKVYVPKYIFIMEKIGAYGFKMMVSFLLTILFMVFYQVPISYRVLWMIPLWLILITITFAISTIVLHFGVFIEDLSNVITVVLQLVFYLSGIFFSIQDRILPKSELIGKLLLYCNPIALVMTDMRNVLLYKQDPHLLAILAWTGVALIVSMIGVKIIYKYENSYVKII